MWWKTGRLVALLLALWILALGWDFVAGIIRDNRVRESSSQCPKDNSDRRDGGLPCNLVWSKPGVDHVYTVVVFAIGITSFVGSLNVSTERRDKPGRLQDGDVRFAVAVAFVAVFFSMLSFYAFSSDTPTPFGQSLVNTLLDQTALIVGFYFATSGALEYLDRRDRHRAAQPAPVTSDTEADNRSAANG